LTDLFKNLSLKIEILVLIESYQLFILKKPRNLINFSKDFDIFYAYKSLNSSKTNFYFPLTLMFEMFNSFI